MDRSNFFTVCSFHPTKTLPSNESGMIICPNNYEKKLKEIINFGQSKKRNKVNIKSPGFNGKISEYACAILLSTLKNLNKINFKLKKNLNLFIKNLNNSDIVLQKNLGKNWISNKINIYSKKYNKDYLQSFFLKKGIKAYNPWTGKLLHKHPYFKNFMNKNLKNSELISKKIISIPFNIDLSKKLITKIAKDINNLS